jgi:hypothetical protein
MKFEIFLKSLQLDQFSIPQCFKTMFVFNVSFASIYKNSKIKNTQALQEL